MSVSRDFQPPFFPCFEPIWAADKQAKVFSNYFFDFAEIFEFLGNSEVCFPPRSQTTAKSNSKYFFAGLW